MLNLSNLDATTITQELLLMGASVFAAQETNVHWDPATLHQLYMQCRKTTNHIYLTTSCSQELAADWYKPGGMLLLALEPCTSRILSRNQDSLLGRWSYIELAGQHQK